MIELSKGISNRKKLGNLKKAKEIDGEFKKLEYRMKDKIMAALYKLQKEREASNMEILKR